jgi:hypothetical protein
VFAAADVDQAKFALAIAGFVGANSTAVLLASTIDEALKSSHRLVPGHQARAGECNRGLMGSLCYHERLLTIDCTRAKNEGQGHGYLFTSSAVAQYLSTFFQLGTLEHFPLHSTVGLEDCYINNDRWWMRRVRLHFLGDDPATL